MTLRVISAPTVEPVTLDQARLWCRIEDGVTTDDDVLELLIKAMREYAENLTGRAFIQRTLEWSAMCFPVWRLELPKPPLVGVESIRYIDDGGDEQTIAAADYIVDTAAAPGVIVPAHLENWPAVRYQPNSVRVRYIAGYATPDGSPTDYAGTVLPAALGVWIRARLSTLYEHREQLIVGTTVNTIPRDFADGLLDALLIGRMWA
jgi:uncharacterized phiE125 gp8 family phage protein